MSFLRPEPVDAAGVQPLTDAIRPAAAAERVIAGERFRVDDHYRTGLKVLEALGRLLDPPAPELGHTARRAYRERLRACSQRLLVAMEGKRCVLRDAPTIGFLPDLYPGLDRYVLPLSGVAELARAWQIYCEGVHYPVLGHRLHPFYATYLPTRTEHLELFATWLSAYDGPKTSAIDVGTGSGILAFMLARNGFERITATDTSPNAIESVRRDIARLDVPPPIHPLVADLCGDATGADVVVFNPPWMPGTIEEPLDAALYYEPGLFERFFAEAHERVAADGRVVLVFSDIVRLVRPDAPHPIDTELASGRFRLVEKLRRKIKPRIPPGGGRPRRTKERVEVWELAPIR